MLGVVPVELMCVLCITTKSNQTDHFSSFRFFFPLVLVGFFFAYRKKHFPMMCAPMFDFDLI